MIRFIDLRGQITNDRDPNFAFFDTVTDRFIDLAGEQEWGSVEEFAQTASVAGKPLGFISRCLNLMPKDYLNDR